MALHTLSLCSGIGALDYGLVGLIQTVCYVERAEPQVSVLKARIESGDLCDAPIWSDLTTFNGLAWTGAVDLVVAGAPCQPFSTAARGRNCARDLLEDVTRVVWDVAPNFVFLENVLGARRRLGLVRDELRGMGYCVPPLAEVSAAAVGAPHQRDRLWLFAYAHGHEQQLRALHAEVVSEPPATFLPWRSEAVARRLSRVPDGSARGVDVALGNAVVPCVARRAFVELVRRAVSA